MAVTVVAQGILEQTNYGDTHLVCLLYYILLFLFCFLQILTKYTSQVSIYFSYHL